jgi:hypothetical protein
MVPDIQDTLRHTDHALLVGLGLFGHQIGLFEALDEVRFPGRVYKRAPQRKLRELLAALAAGYQQLQDIDLAADPIRADPVVVAAWDPQGFAHYSGVSRGLCRADARTVSDLKAALNHVSAPFLTRDVEEALAAGGPLRLEGDTTGVGTTAHLPGVEPGLIEGRLQPGFHIASVSLRTPAYRIMLGSAHFEGKRVSCQTLESLVTLAEQRVGRPRRRVELLYARLGALKQEEQRWRDKADQPRRRAQHFEERAWELHFLIRGAQHEVEVLEAAYMGREVRPHSRLAQARQRLAGYQRKQAAARRHQREAEPVAQRYLDHAEALRVEHQVLQDRIARYEEDNRTNCHPIEVVFSLDGGFGTPENVTLLTELGYQVSTKAHGQTATPHLKRDVSPETVWEAVSNTTQATESQRTAFGRCPYPVRLILMRQQRGETVRHSTLVISPQDAAWGQTLTLARRQLGTAESVHFYNRRQDMEAGIKEFKGVFYMGHMRFFDLEAIQIQEQLITFLPNFIRWAIRYYFRPHAIHIPDRADRGLEQLRDVVRIAMRSQAEISYEAGGCVIRFAPKGAFAGLVIDLRQPLAFQLSLPLFAKLPIFVQFDSNWL